MNELNIFKQDKIQYESKMQNETDEQIKKKLTKEFQEKAKRFLGTSLGIINNSFDIQYSMNIAKEGLTSSFKKINSIARKSDEEVLNDMANLENQISNLEISDEKKETLALAINVVKIYCTNEAPTNIKQKIEVESIKQEEFSGLSKEEKTKKDEEKKLQKELKKDQPYIAFKLFFGIFIIPIICIISVSVFLFLINAFEKAGIYKELMENKTIHKIYPNILYGFIIVLALISAGLINAFIKRKTNNKIVFTLLPFSIFLLIIAFFENILNFINDHFVLDSIPTFLKEFNHSYAILFMYCVLLFFYFFGVFQRHTKTKIIDGINIAIIVYVGILPAINFILELFNISKVGNITKIIYGYKHYFIVSTCLIIFCLVTSMISPYIKISKKTKKETIEEIN